MDPKNTRILTIGIPERGPLQCFESTTMVGGIEEHL